MRVIGAQPSEGSRIPGIRKWPAGVPAEDLRPGLRSTRLVSGEPGRCGGHGAPPGARGRPVRRHLGRRRLLGGAADRARRWRTRPSCSSSATAATATCPPACSRHDDDCRRLPLLPACATPLQLAGARSGGRRAEGAPALPGLRLDALEQPDAGAGGGGRMVDRGGRILLARNAAWAAACSRSSPASWSRRRDAAGRHRARGAGGNRLAVEAVNLIGVYDFQRMNQVIIAYHVRGARRDPAVARTGEYRLFARGPALLACRHRLRAGRLAALAGHEPQFMELPPGPESRFKGQPPPWTPRKESTPAA